MSRPIDAGTGLKVFVDPTTALILGDDDKPAPKNSDTSNMKDDYQQYEKACAQIRQENGLLLDGFGLMLGNKRLSPRTISAHRDNVSFFINTFLLYTNATKRPEDGIGEVDAFLGYWFIRKAMWSTPRTIKNNATSLYKFYAFLAASGKVTLAQLAELKETIALNLPEWQARCERFNSGHSDDWRG
jgi:hypothetical protein